MTAVELILQETYLHIRRSHLVVEGVGAAGERRELCVQLAFQELHLARSVV